MPEKDFTDYVCLILEAKKRVYHIIHIRASPDLKLEKVPHNGHKFIFDRDRAFLMKTWKPWRKTYWNRPIWSLNELLRSKKVGLLLYHEPINPVQKFKDIVHRTPREYVCKVCAGFSTTKERGMKAHLTKKHKKEWSDATVRTEYDEQIEKVGYYDPIHPIHISRVVQPTGKILEAE